MSKEMRRERNRITARESRERKTTYITELEAEVLRLNERIAKLEKEAACGAPVIVVDDLLLSSSSMLLTPEHMGFFDD